MATFGAANSVATINFNAANTYSGGTQLGSNGLTGTSTGIDNSNVVLGNKAGLGTGTVTEYTEEISASTTIATPIDLTGGNAIANAFTINNQTINNTGQINGLSGGVPVGGFFGGTYSIELSASALINANGFLNNDITTSGGKELILSGGVKLGTGR